MTSAKLMLEVDLESLLERARALLDKVWTWGGRGRNRTQVSPPSWRRHLALSEACQRWARRRSE